MKFQKSRETLFAAVLTEVNKPLELLELQPQPLKRGQVFVEMLYSGVCRSQLMEVCGARGTDNWLPHLLGHEGVGIVQRVGPEVTKVNVGDVVVISWLLTQGLDAEPAKYVSLTSGKIINSGKAVTFATHTIVSENRIFLKPTNIDNRVAVLLGCALPTGAGMVLNETKPSHSDQILIIGLGGIGLSILVTLLMSGLTDISVVEPNPDKLILAQRLGAKGSLRTNLNEFPTTDYFDICYEASGLTECIEAGLNLVNTRGTLIFASHPPFGERISIDPHDLIKGKLIKGSWGGGSSPDATASKIEKLNHRKYLKEMISQEYSLFEVNEALADLESGKALRPLINLKKVK